MLKFFIVSIIIWFLIIKILRFKFIVYKGPSGRYSDLKKNQTSQGFKNVKPNKRTDTNNGEYVDYEEVK